VRHVKSNGVAVVRDVVSRGICAGQTNRVSAVRIAASGPGNMPWRSRRKRRILSVCRRPDRRRRCGCTAVIAPGGSIRDAEVIAAADERNIALVFSNYRYFLH